MMVAISDRTAKHQGIVLLQTNPGCQPFKINQIHAVTGMTHYGAHPFDDFLCLTFPGCKQSQKTAENKPLSNTLHPPMDRKFQRGIHTDHWQKRHSHRML